MSRIPTVQPKKNWGEKKKKKQLDKLAFPALQSIHTDKKTMYVLSMYSKFYFDIHDYQTFLNSLISFTIPLLK